MIWFDVPQQTVLQVVDHSSTFVLFSVSGIKNIFTGIWKVGVKQFSISTFRDRISHWSRNSNNFWELSRV